MVLKKNMLRIRGGDMGSKRDLRKKTYLLGFFLLCLYEAISIIKLSCNFLDTNFLKYSQVINLTKKFVISTIIIYINTIYILTNR